MKLPRRTFLQGFGTLMALPTLEAMLPAKASAQAAAAAKRFAMFYSPNGTYLGTQITNRAAGLWQPAAAGTLTAGGLPPCLSPLSANLDDFNILGGVNNTSAQNSALGEGAHSRAITGFATCSPQRSTSAVRVNASLDQEIADELAKRAVLRRHSIAWSPLKPTPSTDSSLPEYMNHLSYRLDKSVPVERSPKVVFDALFAGLNPTQTTQAQAVREEYQQSVIDSVKADVARLNARLGTQDKARLDEYLTEVRALELRAKATPPPVVAGCSKPADPGAAMAGEYNAGGLDAGFISRLNLMIDLTVIAYQCDLTRVATFLIEPESNAFDYSGAVPASLVYENTRPAGSAHIDCAHHNSDLTRIRKLIGIGRMHATFFKRFLDKLKSTSDAGGGTLLDNTLAVWGFGLGDGSLHQHSNIPLVIGGHAGGVRGGRFLKQPSGTRLANLHLTMMQKLDIARTSFGTGAGVSNGVMAL